MMKQKTADTYQGAVVGTYYAFSRGLDFTLHPIRPSYLAFPVLEKWTGIYSEQEIPTTGALWIDLEAGF